MYKIVIAGASSLLSRELKDVFSESPLAASNFALLDEEEAQGRLEEVGDEVTFIQAISSEAFDHADFTFFCGSENLTRRYWQQALRGGSTVLDLSGALDQETGVLIRAPWLGNEAAAVDLFTPAIVPAHPAVIALALLLERLQQAAPIRFAAATVLLPSSEFGKIAMD
ncbi:MAG: Asd/ArgC dimerization domain-containing protein, partial [Terracidiphilus sp.]